MMQIHEISEALSKNRSKKAVSRLVERMAKEGANIGELLQHIDRVPLPLKWHLTWALNHYVEQYPVLNHRQQVQVWNMLCLTRHEGIMRDLWRILSFISIDDEISGAVYDKALLLIRNTSMPVAIRVYAMQAAFNIAHAFPELLAELSETLMPLKNEEAASIQATLKRILKEIEKGKP